MWTKRDFACSATVAVAMFAASLAVVYPTSLTAKNPPVKDNPAPALKFDDFTVRAHLADSPDAYASITPGDLPKVQIEVTNTGKTVATAKFSADVSTASAADRMSRVPMPAKAKPDWTDSYTLDLQPGETKLIDVTTNVKLAARSSARFELTAGDSKVSALRLNAIPPKAESTVAVNAKDQQDTQ